MKNSLLLFIVTGFLSGGCLASEFLEYGSGLHYRGKTHSIQKSSVFESEEQVPLVVNNDTAIYDERPDPKGREEDLGGLFSLEQIWGNIKNIVWVEKLEEQHIPQLQHTCVTDKEALSKQEDEEKEKALSYLGQTWISFKNKDFKACELHMSTLRGHKSPEGFYMTGFMYESKYPNSYLGGSMATKWYHESIARLIELGYTKETSPLYRLALQGLERCKKKGLERANDPSYAHSLPW